MIQRKQSFLSFFSRDKVRPKIEKRDRTAAGNLITLESSNSNVIYRDARDQRKLNDNNSLSLSSREYHNVQSNTRNIPPNTSTQRRITTYDEYGSYNFEDQVAYQRNVKNSQQYNRDNKSSNFQNSKEKEYSRSNHNISYSTQFTTNLNNNNNDNIQNYNNNFIEDERGDVLDDAQQQEQRDSNNNNTYTRELPTHQVGELNRKLNETQTRYTKVTKSNTFRGKFMKYNKPARTKSDLSHLQKHKPKGRSTSNIYNAVNEEGQGVSNQLRYNTVNRKESMNKSFGDLKSNLYISTNKLHDGHSQYDFENRDFDDLEDEIQAAIDRPEMQQCGGLAKSYSDYTKRLLQITPRENRDASRDDRGSLGHATRSIKDVASLGAEIKIKTNADLAASAQPRHESADFELVGHISASGGIADNNKQFSKYVKKIKRRLTNAALRGSNMSLSKHTSDRDFQLKDRHGPADVLGQHHRNETFTDSSGIVENKTNEDRSSLEESQRSQLDDQHASPCLNHNIMMKRGNQSKAEVIKLQGSNIYHSNVELNRPLSSKHKSRSIGHLREKEADLRAAEQEDRNSHLGTRQDTINSRAKGNGASTRNIKIRNTNDYNPHAGKYKERDSRRRKDSHDSRRGKDRYNTTAEREYSKDYSSDDSNSSRSRTTETDDSDSGSGYSDEDEGIETRNRAKTSTHQTGSDRRRGQGKQVLNKSCHNLQSNHQTASGSPKPATITIAKSANVREKIMNFESYSNNNKTTDLNNTPGKEPASPASSHDQKVKNKILASFAKSNFKNNPNFVKRSITSISAKGDAVRSKYGNKGNTNQAAAGGGTNNAPSYNNPFGEKAEADKRQSIANGPSVTKRYSSSNQYRNFIKERFSPKSKLNAHTSTTITVGSPQLTPAQINEKIKKEIETNNKAQTQQLNLLMNKTMKWVMTQEFKKWLPEDMVEYKNDLLTIQMGH